MGYLFLSVDHRKGWISRYRCYILPVMTRLHCSASSSPVTLLQVWRGFPFRPREHRKDA